MNDERGGKEKRGDNEGNEEREREENTEHRRKRRGVTTRQMKNGRGKRTLNIEGVRQRILLFLWAQK